MPAAQPYDTVRREGGSTIFDAKLPAFVPIGRRYDELYKAYYEFKYPREYVVAEQAFVAALEDAREPAAKGDIGWGEVVRDLEGRFGEKFRRLRLGTPAMFLKIAETSPAGLVQVLDTLIVGAKGTLARLAAASDATDDPAIRAAAEWQPAAAPNPFESPMIREQLDQLKAADPVSGGRIADALGGLATLLRPSPDPAAAQRQLEDRIKALGQSPQMQQLLQHQRQMVERMEQRNPEVANAMRRQLDEMERMAADPAGFAAKVAAGAEVPGEADEAAGEEEGVTLPPGRFRFDCGGVRRPTEYQKRLFDRLVERQEALAPKVEQALRAMHAELAESVDLDDPRERVLFPEDARISDVPLDYFRIESIILPESGDRIGISLESIYGHEEHGCALVIEGDEVAEFGGTEVLCLLEDDEGDEYEDDEDEAVEEEEDDEA